MYYDFYTICEIFIKYPYDKNNAHTLKLLQKCTKLIHCTLFLKISVTAVDGYDSDIFFLPSPYYFELSWKMWAKINATLNYIYQHVNPAS